MSDAGSLRSAVLRDDPRHFGAGALRGQPCPSVPLFKWVGATSCPMAFVVGRPGQAGQPQRAHQPQRAGCPHGRVRLQSPSRREAAQHQDSDWPTRTTRCRSQAGSISPLGHGSLTWNDRRVAPNSHCPPVRRARGRCSPLQGLALGAPRDSIAPRRRVHRAGRTRQRDSRAATRVGCGCRCRWLEGHGLGFRRGLRAPPEPAAPPVLRHPSTPADLLHTVVGTARRTSDLQA